MSVSGCGPPSAVDQTRLLSESTCLWKCDSKAKHLNPRDQTRSWGSEEEMEERQRQVWTDVRCCQTTKAGDELADEPLSRGELVPRCSHSAAAPSLATSSPAILNVSFTASV